MENIWLAIFWWRRQKSDFEIAPKHFFVFFFNRKLIFVLKQTVFEKKNLHAKFNFLCV